MGKPCFNNQNHVLCSIPKLALCFYLSPFPYNLICLLMDPFIRVVLSETLTTSATVFFIDLLTMFFFCLSHSLPLQKVTIYPTQVQHREDRSFLPCLVM